MRIRTVRDLGAAVREARSVHGMTQADLAAAVGVSRDWVVRLERGHPRLEAQLVLDALHAAGVPLSIGAVEATPDPDDHEFDEVLRSLDGRSDG